MKTKERVKKGELHPDEAIVEIKRDSRHSRSIVKWLDTTGRRRYARATRKDEENEQDDIE